MATALIYDRMPERAAARRTRRVFYPTGDGKPMAETEAHVLQIAEQLIALRLYCGRRAYVAGNNFVYYEQGNPKARISPDTYIVPGVSTRLRDSYKVWEEGGKPPTVVFEITSKGTMDEDLRRKFELYEQVLKVVEYFLFDPKGEYLSPPLRGYRLQNGRYVPIPLEDGRMRSEQIGLELVLQGDRLRFYDPTAGRFLPTLEESEAQRAIAEAGRNEAEAGRTEAEAGRTEAEAEVARLRAELAALRDQASHQD